MKILLAIVALCASLCQLSKANPTKPEKKIKPVVIGYVAGYKGIIDTSILQVDKLTHINYAFVDIKDNRAWLHHENTDTVNFRNLVALKKKNPALQILISIGGWSWSKNFSDAALTDTGRKNFAASAVAIVQQYNLDGVDIDWEYPNMQGDGNIYRPEDKQNYTLIFQAIRQQLDAVQHLTKQKYLLTTAAGGFNEFLKNTEMAKAQQYLDFINLMTYDYGWGTAGHHTNLYPTKTQPEGNAANRAVQAFVAAGVPAKKLVMGLAFYGRGWTVEDTANNGMGQKVASNFYTGGYSFIKDSIITRDGFVRYWDDAAQAPYLFNSKEKIFISYDDEQSVKAKCQYVKQQSMGGVMFWEYSDDPKTYLLQTITKNLN